jgi:hypothetical protein
LGVTTPAELTGLTEAKGIHQSDVIIRTALVMAIRDIRANPWLLDHVFATLIEDAATAAQYGDKERAQAKAWFLKTEIPVVMDYRLEGPEGTCISISLVDSSEAEVTLADIHYEPSEEAEAAWAPLAGPFVATYNPVTGAVEIPTSVAEKVFVSPGQLLIDKTGGTHAILTVTDETQFTIEAGVSADFKACFIKGQKPRLIRNIESAVYKESYRIGCHAHGDPFVLTWLHSIVIFALLRYKARLLEARGFERSVLSTSPFAKDERWNVQNMWTRFISISGYVRQFWPADINERITSVGVSPINASRTDDPDATEFVTDGVDEEDAIWLASDGIGAIVEPEIDLDE